MKTKTLLEYLTLSSSIYVLARDTKLLEKLQEYSEKSKENINNLMADTPLDENGNELEFLDKLALKTRELKDELDEKIEELVIKFYKKIKVAHLDEIKALNEKIEKLERTTALLEARMNRIKA